MTPSGDRSPREHDGGAHRGHRHGRRESQAPDGEKKKDDEGHNHHHHSHSHDDPHGHWHTHQHHHSHNHGGDSGHSHAAHSHSHPHDHSEHDHAHAHAHGDSHDTPAHTHVLPGESPTDAHCQDHTCTASSEEIDSDCETMVDDCCGPEPKAGDCCGTYVCVCVGLSNKISNP